ncbi:helix-turn-helix domain-containing protein [Chryseobacterium sp. Marseille-Q8038]
MKTKASQYFIILLTIFGECLFAQKNEKYSDYYILRRNYEGLPENDSSAKPFVEKYIVKAKKEKNYERLVRGYLDGLLFSPSPNDKLKYADSTIWASKMTRDEERISSAYLEKGVVYYFQFKKYQLALDEFLKASEYSIDGKDIFYQNRLSYFIGIVKSYIGHYGDALEHFKKTSAFFQNESRKKMHPNLLYANIRGYLNSIHQMAVCYRNLKDYKTADSLVSIGLSETSGSKEYLQEYGYFLKERGIAQFRKKDYKNAISSLKSSIGSISAVNDFAWVSVCYSYIGKSYLASGENVTAVLYFQKVDSVFQKHNFVLPEVRDNYELLINHYKGENNIHKELYYTKQLLKVDALLSIDFRYLFSKLYKEYDTKRLTQEMKRLEKESARASWVNISVFLSAGVIIILITLKYNKREKQIKKNYKALEQTILNKDVYISSSTPIKQKEHDRQDLDDRLKYGILDKLTKFENNLEFLEKGLTIAELAVKFDTNSNYLSQIINDYKGMTFSQYLIALRINYITERLYKERKFLTYKIAFLAEICGIASRSNFSKRFQEINGIRPTDFIKNRQKDLDTFSSTNEADSSII